MARSRKPKTPKPANSMKNLEEQGFISELYETRNLLGHSIWKFQMGKLTFHYDGKSLDIDLSNSKFAKNSV